MSNENTEALKRALAVVGDKWSLIILMHLHEHGSSRYSDCQKADSINTKTLTQRFTALEQAGLISKQEYKEYPPRTEYKLTKKGRALVPAFTYLAQWSRDYLPRT